MHHILFTVCSPRRHGATWSPDLEYYKQFDMPILLPKDDNRLWKVSTETKYEPPVEKSVTNINLNFGPQHPAAHGVLRLVLELDGEVCSFISFCQLLIFYDF